MIIYRICVIFFILTVVFTGGCSIENSTGFTSDSLDLMVSSVIPVNSSVNVPVNLSLAVTFSKLLKTSSITGTTFYLKQDETPVPGGVSCVGAVAVFNPADNLTPGAIYTATVTRGVADLDGKKLREIFSWNFTAGSEIDITPPVVGSTIPTYLIYGIDIESNISVFFNEGMDPLSVNNSTFMIYHGSTKVAGEVTLAGMTAVFNPTFILIGNTTYTAKITTGVRDLAGNYLAEEVTWNFTTGANYDDTPPVVLSTFPADLGENLPVNTHVTATFNEGMNPLSVNTVTFLLKTGTANVSGTVILTGSVATFNPAVNLASETIYSATVTRGVTDLAGNHLVINKTWRFATGAVVAAGPQPVNLGTADSYVILSESGITNVPPSVITGNIAVSPISSVAITGFELTMNVSGAFATSSQVVGSVYGANYSNPTPENLGIAVSNMRAAYTNAAYRSTPDFTDLNAGEIGGQILIPGLYKWNTEILISTDLTLNGGPDDVWIFQTTSGITLFENKRVLLTGGARPGNIFWQSDNVVALNADSHIEGVILSRTSITLESGATVNGRLYAQTAVTLLSNIVTQPGQ